jgi:hypothetical protein
MLGWVPMYLNFLHLLFRVGILCVSMGIPAFAFAQFEEYSFFSESEIREINTPLLIDSEYFSDIHTYRLPVSMSNTFHRKDKVYDLSIGSLSRTRFATQHRLKVDSKIGENTTFRLVYLEKKNLEESMNHLLLELQYRLSSLLRVAGYTQLLSEKKWNDFGAAAIVDWNSNHSLRFYVGATDSSFNKRTESNDVDREKAYVYGFVGRLLTEEDNSFFEYYAQVQTPIQRVFLDEAKEYTFRETKFGTRGVMALSSLGGMLNFDFSYKHRWEGEQGAGADPLYSGLWKSSQYDLLTQYENTLWLVGVSGFLRDWNVRSTNVNLDTIQPHFYYKWTSDRLGGEFLRLGYEVSINEWEGPQELRTPPDRNRDWEHRANLRYTINFNSNAFLHLFLTADLDDPSWEGGNGIFQIVF